LYINCPKETTESGVETRHFSSLKLDRSDIFITTTSGGQYDVGVLGDIELKNRLKILLVHGVAPPNNLPSYPFDFVYSPSNFIRGKVFREWGVAHEKLFVSHRGIEEANFTRHSQKGDQRDPFALLYLGHPSKGLETAIYILRSLRLIEPRFHMHVYGGAGLWGEAGQDPPPEEGISFHGIVGQRRLSSEIQCCSFSLNFQHRQEPFGMAVIEAMRAGCIVLASPVGAYSEIVTHGQNGILVPGDHTQNETRQTATDLILSLVRNQEYIEYLRRNAMKTPLTWDTIARTWEGHWDWVLSGRPTPDVPGLGTCNDCHGAWLPLADGLHCSHCGNYQRNSSP
jgi:glycosyltransferase involved in cell wall biosynthesis